MAVTLPILPEINSIPRWIQQSISESPLYSNGLAVLIGCEHSLDIRHPPLFGVRNDLALLQDTFSKLMFTTLPLYDPTGELVKTVVKTVSNLLKHGIKQPDSWKRIVITFSGHGDQNFLYTKNEKLILQGDILDPVIMSKDSCMVGIAKLFFVDACRGSNEDIGIDLDSLRYRYRGETLTARGERVPTKGNYLIAYSTILGMKAFETQTGGLWIQTLSRLLLDPEHIDCSIHDILVDVNSCLLDQLSSVKCSLQQPESTSTLNEKIFLQKEAKAIRGAPSPQTGPPPSRQQQPIPEVQHKQQIMFNRQPLLASGNPGVAPHRAPFPAVSLPGSSGNVGYPLLHLPPALPGQTPRSQVLLQHGVLVDPPRYNSPANEGAAITLQGRSPSQEAAAQVVPSPPTASGTAGTKSFKKQLEEYYISKGKNKPVYKHKEKSNGHICTVLCSDLGYLNSDLKPSRKEAEQDAAHKALLKLKVIKN